jgi:hypothetical protein
MMGRVATRVLLPSLLVGLALGACTCGDPALGPGEILGDGFESVTSTSATSVEVKFSRNIDRGTANKSSFAIHDFTVIPSTRVGISAVDATDDRTVKLTTDTLSPGTRYTLTVKMKDSSGRPLEGTLNFIATGAGGVVQVQIEITDVETARLHTGGLTVMATVDEDGAFSEELLPYPMTDDGARFVATLDVLSDEARTLDPGDDADPLVDRRPYAVLVMDDAGRMASQLVRFVVNDTASRVVDVDVLPPIEIVNPPDTDVLPDPPEDPTPGDNIRQVRVVVDDRASHELQSPELKVAFGADGGFDASFPRTLPLTPMTGENEGYWEVVVGVKVDPARVADGTSNDTFPYFAFLVENGEPHEAIDVAITAPDETPATVRLSLGNPEWVPVTFRVDTSRAYLNASGTLRDHHPDEAIFLTGEWQQAADYLGNNCGDAFTGGENACLEMRELPDHPGVWQRTLWLPGGRPYGWKVVRCTAGYGCGDLNNLVASSGRAFATVMKNLATDNVDAFADPNVGIVDPLSPSTTEAGGQTRDYTNATVYLGQNIGGEPDPAGTPDGARMFKQEVPDLVVVVDTQPLKTRVIHVGTWRDVNLSVTPQQIVEQQLSVQLTPVDYDDGFIGRFPPSRAEP